MVAERALHILYISPFYDARFPEPVEAMNRFPLMGELTRQVHQRGHQVRVLGLAGEPAALELDGVKYRWVTSPQPVQTAARMMHRWKPHHGPAFYEPSLALARAIRDLEPDIAHVFGLTMDVQLALIGSLLPGSSRLVVHYHGGQPAEGIARRSLEKLAMRRVDAACFTARSQAQPWVDVGLLHEQQVHQILETSSPFTPMDREEAREQTGMTGDPIYLSTGRLHPIKDPLTMLRGFAHIARRQPEARLYLHYISDEMLQEARSLVHAFPYIRNKVAFQGRASAEDMPAIYSSADILLQASLREWSGLAVLEAMSCGCIPVVSDIPSFTAMTDGGRYGRHFPRGDARALADAALSISHRGDLSTAVIDHFEKELSFAAMARDLEAVYQQLVGDA